MLTFTLYILYFVFFYLVFKTYSFTRDTGFSYKIWYGVFIIKFLAGCLNLYVHNHFYVSNDVFFYYKQAVEELIAGRKDPIGFFKYWLFDWEDMAGHLNFFHKENMVYWSTLGTLIHTKLMTLFTILTLGNEYLNILFYNFLFFIGQLAFYKTLYAYFHTKKTMLLVAVFFIPSVLFWASGIHKDGLIFSISGFIIYYANRFIHEKKWNQGLALLFFMLLLLAVRYFYFLCLFSALLGLLLARNKNPIWPFLGLYLVLAGVFFFGKNFMPLDPMNLIKNKQTEYFKAKGYSDLETPVLENTIGSYIQNLPTAVNHVFLRPYPNPLDKKKYFLHGLDTWLVLCCLLVSLIFISRKKINQPLFLFVLFYCLSVLLFMGYTIPNLGAVVRYRSPFIGMLLPLLLMVSDIPWFRWNPFQKRQQN